MKRYSYGVVAAVASFILVAGISAWAQDREPTTRPSDQSRSGEARAARGSSGRWGFAPYNRLSNVSDEQKLKINEIHRKALAEIRAIEERQEADIMALLTDEQKAELTKMQEERRAAQKARDAERRAKTKEDDGDEKDK